MNAFIDVFSEKIWNTKRCWWGVDEISIQHIFMCTTYTKNTSARRCVLSYGISVHMSYKHPWVQGANMGPTWVLSAPDGPHVGPIYFAIWDVNGVDESQDINSCSNDSMGRSLFSWNTQQDPVGLRRNTKHDNVMITPRDVVLT